MQQRQQAFDGLRIRTVVVTFEAAPFVRAYIAETMVTWLILIDPDRTLYRGYDMHRGRLRDIWGVRTWLAYMKELARGRLPKYSGADTRQLGGDVLIDPAGIVRFHHVGTGPADRPSVAAILEARRQP
ncbi:MAG: hypothetical protein HYX77_05720 [Acidobacteria bacterium]|nr:hypothetical protein [Acidobacteriota bacterium]